MLNQNESWNSIIIIWQELPFKKMRIIILTIALVLVSCTTYSDEEIQEFDEQIEVYLKKQKLSYSRSEDGLYYRIENAGKGRKIQYNDSVLISYKGSLLDGKIVDYQKTPIWFAVKDLISGWKQGLTMVSKEAELKLIVPPQLGYGAHELESIPKNSILIYELKVFDIH
jgi:FKBP-type peptidyl-prolyl cis-trans isomerase FkpA